MKIIKTTLLSLALASLSQAAVVSTTFGAFSDDGVTTSFGDYTLTSSAQTNNRLARATFTTEVDILGDGSGDTYRLRIDERRSTGATYVNGVYTAATATSLNNIGQSFFDGVVAANNTYTLTYSLGVFAAADSAFTTLTSDDVLMMGSAINNFTLSAGEYYITNSSNTEGFYSTGGLIAVPEWADLSDTTLLISNVGTTDGSVLSYGESTVSYEAIPEPSSAALLGLGGIALLMRRKRAA